MTTDIRLFNSNEPIYLGISGRAGTGKSIIAGAIAPFAKFGITLITDDDPAPMHWDHYSFSAPLYSLASMKNKVNGWRAEDRVKYEILNLLLKVFGDNPMVGAIPYNDLNMLVHEIYQFQITSEGKPRDFLEKYGDRFRSLDDKCLIRFLKKAIDERILLFNKEIEYDRNTFKEMRPDELVDALEPRHYGALIVDVRTEDEARWILEHENGLLVKLVADDPVRKSRVIDRDGGSIGFMDRSDLETSVDRIPRDWFTAIIDTSEEKETEQGAAPEGVKEIADTINHLVFDYMNHNIVINVPEEISVA